MRGVHRQKKNRGRHLFKTLPPLFQRHGLRRFKRYCSKILNLRAVWLQISVRHMKPYTRTGRKGMPIRILFLLGNKLTCLAKNTREIIEDTVLGGFISHNLCCLRGTFSFLLLFYTWKFVWVLLLLQPTCIPLFIGIDGEGAVLHRHFTPSPCSVLILVDCFKLKSCTGLSTFQSETLLWLYT